MYLDSNKTFELIDAPMWHHKHGVSYTSTGYGSKIPSRFKIEYNGRKHRIYIIQYSNAGSAYIIVKGERRFLHDYQLKGV